MEIVINEWLLHYSKFDSDIKKKKMVYDFLCKLRDKDFKIIINWECPFIKKFNQFWDASKNNNISHTLFRTLHLLFHDSKKVKSVEFDDTILIPKEIKEKCPDDDLYLILLAFNSKDQIIITEDIRLIEKMKEHTELTFLSPEEFLKNFDC